MATMTKPPHSAPVLKVSKKTYARVMANAKAPKPANAELRSYVAKGKAALRSN